LCERFDVIRIDKKARLSYYFWERRYVGGNYRTPARHRFKFRKFKPLIERWIDEDVGLIVKGEYLGVGQISGESYLYPFISLLHILQS